MLAFVEPAAVRIGCADLYLFLRSAARFSGRWIVVIVILVLQWFLSVSQTILIDLFLKLFLVEKE